MTTGSRRLELDEVGEEEVLEVLVGLVPVVTSEVMANFVGVIVDYVGDTEEDSGAAKEVGREVVGF